MKTIIQTLNWSTTCYKTAIFFFFETTIIFESIKVIRTGMRMQSSVDIIIMQNLNNKCMSGAGIAQWLERRTRDWKVVGSNPRRSGRRIFFSRVDFMCWLLFRYPFHPRDTAVARKRSRSFCQKCRWQVTAKHTYTLRTWLCMMWHGAWLYGVHRTCAETAAVSCGTSPASAVSTPLRWILKIRAIKS